MYKFKLNDFEIKCYDKAEADELLQILNDMGDQQELNKKSINLIKYNLRTKLYQKRFRIKNIDKVKEYQKDYRAKNKEYQKEYYLKHKDKLKQYTKEYYLKNKAS